MPRIGLFSLCAAAAAGFAGAVHAQLLYDADTEALAKATVEKYRAADLDGAFETARENLRLVREFSMKSVTAGADYQALVALRSVVDPGGRGFTPDVAVFEGRRSVFKAQYYGETDRVLHELLHAEFGLADEDSLKKLRGDMKNRLDDLKAADKASDRKAAAPATRLRPPLRNVDIGSRMNSPQAKTGPDCSAERLAMDDADGLKGRFDMALDCAVAKAGDISEQKKVYELDKRRYAMIDLCLARVASGKYDPQNLPQIDREGVAGATAKIAAPSTADRFAAVQAAQSRRAAAVDGLEELRALASACAGDALIAYFDALASEKATESDAFKNLLAPLFQTLTKDGPPEGCSDCATLPHGNPFANDAFRTSWQAIFKQWRADSGDGPFDKMQQAIKAIQSARLQSVISAETPGKTPKEIANWLTKAAAYLDGHLSKIATTASDLGVSLAAVESQLDAVNFILEAGAQGKSPELDPAKACGALQGDAKTACEARLALLSPRVKAAAAIAGSAPGLLLAMQTLIDETAEPPPLQLVIAKEQLGVRAAALGKRLAVLDAERLVWANLARNYGLLAEKSEALLESLGGLCDVFDRASPPPGETCTPVSLPNLYKAPTGEALTPDRRKAVLDAGGRYADLVWLNTYAADSAFQDLLHLAYENLLLIDEETTGLAAAAIGAALSEIDFRAKRGLKAESVADFTARLINLGLLSAIAIGGD
ncbi:MAG: hypothetical protein HXY23_05925 [Parvularculaceae bacterium]|nr:hypothetical protein [Parvularculaceae bacterium]